MSKLPGFRRLRREDYPVEFQDLVEQLSASLNIGIEAIYDVLNQKANVGENIDSSVNDLTITLSADGTPVERTQITIHKSETIQGLTIVKTENLTNPATFPTTAPYATWTQNGSTVDIDHITGLNVGDEWQIKVLTWG